MPNTDDLISVAEVAERTKVDRRTVHRWVESGRLVPALKIPGKTGAYLFRRSDVEALIIEAAS